MRNFRNILFLILSIVIFAGCSLVANKQYTVKFMVDQEVYHTVTDVATNITIPEIDPILSGYEFDGWYLDEDYTRIFSTTELKKEKQTTVDVYAKFLKLYTLSFETNGGEELDPISIATAASSFSATRRVMFYVDGIMMLDL